MKCFIFQSKEYTAIVIAQNSRQASSILIEKLADDPQQFYLAGSVLCNEGANTTVSSYISIDTRTIEP